jgi:putative membrane protein
VRASAWFCCESETRLRVPARTTSNRPSDHRDKLADLKKLSGEKFDKKYIEQAGVKDHKAALKLFKDAAEDAKDPELKRFAQKEVDHIQEHLQMAQRIADIKK